MYTAKSVQRNSFKQLTCIIVVVVVVVKKKKKNNSGVCHLNYSW